MYDPSDPHQKLVFESEVSYAVLGNDAGAFRLVSTALPLDERATRADVAAGFRYAGVVGVHEGIPGVRTEDDWVSRAACIGAALEVSRRLREQRAAECGDEIDFLERLYALPDLRV